MSFSISDLGNVESTEPVDMSALAPKGPSFPRPGIYTLRVPATIEPEYAFSTTQAGYLAFSFDPEIVGPSNEGYVIRFQKLSAKTFPETDRKTGEVRQTSQIARFLAACGYKGQLNGDPQQLVDVIMEQAGKEFKAVVDWRAYNKRTGEATVDMEKFPTNNYGEHLPWVLDEGDLDDEGKPRRVRANLYVKRYLSAR